MAVQTLQSNYAIRAFGRVIRVDAWGSWGIDEAVAYSHDLKRRVERMPHGYALLAVSHGQSLHGPEAEAVMRYSVRWRVSHGCLAQATVVEDPILVDIARSQHKQIYIHQGLKQEIFCSLRDAESWLACHGFPEAFNIERGAILDLEHMLGLDRVDGFGDEHELLHFYV